MAFSNWTDFFNMGGHAVYVWSAYGVTCILLLACLGIGYWRHQKLIQRIRKNKGRNSHASSS